MAYFNQYTQPNPQEQVNPTAVTQSTKEFGEDTARFNVDPFAQPFPFAEEKAESSEFRGRFGEFLGGLETPEATRQRYENRYGYQPLREEYQRSSEMMGDLSSSISAKPDQVLGRGRETIMTSGQMDQITEKEVGDLMKIYQGVGVVNEQQGSRLAFIEQNMNDAAQLELAQQQKMSQPWLMEYETMAIQQAKKFTGWTFANQLELDRLVGNRNAGKEWTTEEADRANKLAIAEGGWKNNLDMISAKGDQDRQTQKAPRSSSLADMYKSFA